MRDDEPEKRGERRGLPRKAVTALLSVVLWGAMTLEIEFVRAPLGSSIHVGAPGVRDQGPMVANLEETSTINCDNPQGLLQEAECGHEFRKYYNMTRHDLEGIRVAFYGHIIGSSAFEFQRVSGCPITSKNGAPACLQDPSCSMFKIAKGGDLRGADVVMVDRIDAERLTKTRSWDREIPRMFTRTDQKTGEVLHRRRFRVLYVREASFVSIEAQSEVDFVMGVHYWHGLLNPNFLMRPSTFARRNAKVADAVASKGRPKFAVSVASNCEPTHSRRGVYIDDLAKALGSRGNVDRYGSCHGALAAPPKPLSKMAPIAAEYKFYLAFENTIMDGYVTEKLLQSLTFGPVPVYMGAADIFNITRTPSFINVQDFGSPAELADYLIYLANNQTAYEEYHSWRHVPLAEALSEDYLQRVSRHVPSLAAYAEIRKAYEEVAPQRKVNPLRVANCCTLCNPRLLDDLTLASSISRRFIAERPWSASRIRAELYRASASKRRTKNALS